jgi:DNA-binding transcriptional ArsR family regulator
MRVGSLFDRTARVERREPPSSRPRAPFRSIDLTYISALYHSGPVHAFDVLGDPVRRRILELLAGGEQASGAITAIIQREFGITQPAVSQHLRVLRDSGFATVRREGTRRLYTVDSAPLRDVDAWLDHFRDFWNQPLDALATELARGRRERRLRSEPTTKESDR